MSGLSGCEHLPSPLESAQRERREGVPAGERRKREQAMHARERREGESGTCIARDERLLSHED
jgi:hypothetical protein